MFLLGFHDKVYALIVTSQYEYVNPFWRENVACPVKTSYIKYILQNA